MIFLSSESRAKFAWVILSESNLSKIDAKHNNEEYKNEK